MTLWATIRGPWSCQVLSGPLSILRWALPSQALGSAHHQPLICSAPPSPSPLLLLLGPSFPSNLPCSCLTFQGLPPRSSFPPALPPLPIVPFPYLADSFAPFFLVSPNSHLFSFTSLLCQHSLPNPTSHSCGVILSTPVPPHWPGGWPRKADWCPLYLPSLSMPAPSPILRPLPLPLSHSATSRIWLNWALSSK